MTKSPQKIHNDWPSLRRQALEWAEKAALAAGASSKPTALGVIAKRQTVATVTFCPLFVDGGIYLDDLGFHISVNCEASRCAEYSRRWANDPTGSNLPPRMRFTLAHEIAHTYFFDLTKKKPVSKVDYTNPRTLHSLERACHLTASELLLPETILAETITRGDLLRPIELRKLAHNRRISPSAVVVRLAHLRRCTHPFGIILAVDTQITGGKIVALSRHYGYSACPQLAIGALLSTSLDLAQFPVPPQPDRASISSGNITIDTEQIVENTPRIQLVTIHPAAPTA